MCLIFEKLLENAVLIVDFVTGDCGMIVVLIVVSTFKWAESTIAPGYPRAAPECGFDCGICYWWLWNDCGFDCGFHIQVSGKYNRPRLPPGSPWMRFWLWNLLPVIVVLIVVSTIKWAESTIAPRSPQGSPWIAVLIVEFVTGDCGMILLLIVVSTFKWPESTITHRLPQVYTKSWSILSFELSLVLFNENILFFGIHLAKNKLYYKDLKLEWKK